jgi:predicted MFS family arabinose efflux permease
MALLLFLGGSAIAPTLIAGLSLTERTVPVSRRTEGLAIMHTGIAAGIAPGAMVSGLVIDHAGASAAYLVSLGAGVVAAIAAQTVPRRSGDSEVQRDAAPVEATP